MLEAFVFGPRSATMRIAEDKRGRKFVAELFARRFPHAGLIIGEDHSHVVAALPSIEVSFANNKASSSFHIDTDCAVQFASAIVHDKEPEGMSSYIDSAIMKGRWMAGESSIAGSNIVEGIMHNVTLTMRCIAVGLRPRREGDKLIVPSYERNLGVSDEANVRAYHLVYGISLYHYISHMYECPRKDPSADMRLPYLRLCTLGSCGVSLSTAHDWFLEETCRSRVRCRKCGIGRPIVGKTVGRGYDFDYYTGDVFISEEEGIETNELSD